MIKFIPLICNNYTRYYFGLKNIINKRKLTFSAHENEYAHNKLLNLPNYEKTTISKQYLEPNTKKLLKTEAIISICKESEFSEETSKSFMCIIENLENNSDGSVSFEILKPLIDKLSMISDNELIEMLLTCISLSLLNQRIFYPSENFTFFTKLARECINRTKQWNRKQILLIADIWYVLGGPVSSIFLTSAVRILLAQPQLLSPSQLTQCFFYLSIIRHFVFHKQQLIIERKIMESLNHLEIDEFGIIAMGCFKTQNRITDINLLKEATNFIIKNKQNISDITLNSVLKLMQYSFNGRHTDHAKYCILLINEMKQEITSRNNYVIVRLASIGNYLNLYNNVFLDTIVEWLIPNFNSMRIKELDRLCFVIMNSKIQLKEYQSFISSIEKELQSPERAEEIKAHFQSFVSCIYYLACMGHYSSLVSEVLRFPQVEREQAEKKVHTNSERDRSICQLDLMLQIEGPAEYQQFQLPQKSAQLLRQKYVKQFIALSSQNHFNILEKTLLRLMKKPYMKSTFLLPSFPLSVVLFCSDEEGNLVKFPHDQFNYDPEDIKYTLNRDHQKVSWHAVAAVGWYAYLHDTNRLRGVFAAQTRLMETLGYNVILVQSRILKSRNDEVKINMILNCFHRAINKEAILKLKKQY